MDVQEIGKWLILFGLFSLLLGGILLLVGKIPAVGRLPGDIIWKKDHVTIYFPIVTMLLLSILLTILLNIIVRFLSGK